MDTIQVDTLHKDLSFTGDLLLDGTFLLLPQTAPISQELIEALTEWEFTTVLCDGNLSLGGDIGIESNSDDNSNTSKENFGVSLKKAIASTKSSYIVNSDQSRMDMVESVFNEYMNYIEKVFTHYATHKEIDQAELSETIQELVMFVKDHKRYILRINPNPDDAGKNFLVIHSMRTTVLAIAIAQQLHLPLSKIIEVGVACIIHEIGMLRVPPQLYMSSRNLTIGERATISKHTIFGYTIVKDLKFPLSIQLGVLEHHEKENGSGYPRKMTGDKISSNAKIIAVACSFEAISSPRGYKAERSTFDAMIELIQNKNHAYDDSVLKALLYTVSLYPIGTYVYLSNRKVAIICDTNPDNPKYPIAQLLTEKNKDGSPIQIPTDPSGINIVRILSKNEVSDIKKFLAQHKAEEVQISETAPEEPAEVIKHAVEANSNEMYVENSSTEEDFSSKHTEQSFNDDGTENIDISMFE
ncbi:MAG: HD domain-containing protein [Spirochaetia bacterium]|nr:HD domain-containing protein [Spirochaetia bacterium]MDY4986095.1 HD domain-containing protein [Treponema sp.]